MNKKIKKSIFLVVSVMTMLLFVACGKDNSTETEEPKTINYKVSVVDALGNPYTSGVVVRFLSGSEQVAMQVCDNKGVATKELDNAEYNIEVSFTDGDENYSYNKEGLKVNADNSEIKVVVAYNLNENASSLYYESEEYDAYSVAAGCTKVTLVDGRNFYLFKPDKAGTYEFSIPNGNVETIGYYGSPHYVQKYSAAEVTDGKFKVSVSESMIGQDDTGTTVIVVGIDKKNDDECILAIERIGEPEHTLADEPWTIYNKTVELKEYALPEGAVLAEFDLTKDSYDIVFNELDGYYHLNSTDGPLVLMKLTKDSKYLACFKTILDNTGVVKYFFDEDENFIKKESYSECLLEYIEYADEKSGTYPLTKDLKYILEQRGEYAGWWDADSQMYLFVDENGVKVPGINADIAWLFMCCYIEK